MVLIPGQGVVVQGIPAKNLLRRIRVEQVEHEQDGVDILLVEDCQIVHLLLVREERADRAKDLCLLAHFRYDKKLRDEALREQKAGLAVGVEICKLGHEGLDVGVGAEAGWGCAGFRGCIGFQGVV